MDRKTSFGEFSTDKKFAVLVDCDNISSEYIDAIMAEIAKKGDIILTRQ